MQICSIQHQEVCFDENEQGCPVCRALDNLYELTGKHKELEIEYLELKMKVEGL